MGRLIRSSLLVALYVISNYPEQKIPVMGARSVLRFYELKHIESIVAKIEWFGGCSALCDGATFCHSVNAYNFIQMPVSRETLDLLYQLADIEPSDPMRIRCFLCAHTYQFEEIVRAVCILAYHYTRSNILEKFGVTLNRDYRGIITWRPHCLPHFGWSSIELINDQMVVIPYDSHFVWVIDCSGNTGSVKTYPK